ncbi:ABC transporter ATP-binding protein [Rhizobium sp. Root1220]|uniref:ABC transporter ATP-binding protein n=1 Tax=Rhizobium sp. Root1220 TaxID=1736432 RepID=UPI0006FF47E0|nr:ABC transporter ATP-binding protein [Rhizobium sp. Root1220]KQV70367.1 ABC transporter ATP-binding protein [Rhizobium sp. Root1220]
MSSAAAALVLDVRNLAVDALTPEGRKPVLRDISFDLTAGETLCIAGESGSGKSVTSLAIMGLLPKASLRVASGNIILGDRDLLTLSNRAMRSVRGGDIAMVFQEPMTSLNPVMSVGAQLTEAIREHQGSEQAEAVALRMLDAVQISEPTRRLRQFPHELSGGMRQRVMIAMALSCRPKVLIADEPTTALDVTVQAQILKLMRELKSEFGTSIILITHDMGVVAEMADRVIIMQHGRIVETGRSATIFNTPSHTYTQQLLAAVPRLGAMAGTDGPPRVTPQTGAVPRPDRAPVMNVSGLNVSYGTPSGRFFAGTPPVKAVSDVSFDIRPGETLGLVGESGSGKSTTGKAVLGLIPFTGDVVIDGRNIAGLGQRDMLPVRRAAQMIFQDPYASLDPRMAIGPAIAEPMLIHGIGNKTERQDRVEELLRRVGLAPDTATRYPHEFSGGQRQRICIARALALEPRIIIADESVAALDVSVRARVLDLLLELQEAYGLAYLFISHDMAVVERMCHKVAVMRHGKIVEAGSRRDIFENPKDAYTQSLMDAVPTLPPAPARATA